MSDANNIWQQNEGGLSQQKLTDYLEGRLSAEEQREVEAYLAEEGMESDAIDGLMAVSKEDTNKLTEKINYRLQHDLRKQSNKRKKLFKDDKWGWVAVVIVILMIVLTYWLLNMSNAN